MSASKTGEVDVWDVYEKVASLEAANRDVYHKRLAYHTNVILLLYGVVAAGLWKVLSPDGENPKLLLLLAAVTAVTATFATLSPSMLRRVYSRVLEFTLARELIEQRLGLRAPFKDSQQRGGALPEEAEEWPWIMDIDPAKILVPAHYEPWTTEPKTFLLPSEPYSIRVNSPKQARRHGPRVAAAVFLGVPLLFAALVSVLLEQPPGTEVAGWHGVWFATLAIGAVLHLGAHRPGPFDRFPEILQALGIVLSVFALLAHRPPPPGPMFHLLAAVAAAVLFVAAVVAVQLTRVERVRIAWLLWKRCLTSGECPTLASRAKRFRDLAEGCTDQAPPASGYLFIGLRLLTLGWSFRRGIRDDLIRGLDAIESLASPREQRPPIPGQRSWFWSAVGLSLVAGSTVLLASVLGGMPDQWLSNWLAIHVTGWGPWALAGTLTLIWVVPDALDHTIGALVQLPEDLFEWLSPNVRSRHRYHVWMTGVMRLLGLGGFIATAVLAILGLTQ
jgi:hypothetical protein